MADHKNEHKSVIHFGLATGIGAILSGAVTYYSYKNFENMQNCKRGYTWSPDELKNTLQTYNQNSQKKSFRSYLWSNDISESIFQRTIRMRKIRETKDQIKFEAFVQGIITTKNIQENNSVYIETHFKNIHVFDDLVCNQSAFKKPTYLLTRRFPTPNVMYLYNFGSNPNLNKPEDLLKVFCNSNTTIDREVLKSLPEVKIFNKLTLINRIAIWIAKILLCIFSLLTAQSLTIRGPVIGMEKQLHVLEVGTPLVIFGQFTFSKKTGEVQCTVPMLLTTKRYNIYNNSKKKFIISGLISLLLASATVVVGLKFIQSLKEYIRKKNDSLRKKNWKNYKPSPDELCVICAERPKQALLLPCKHLSMCKRCLKKNKNNKCPFCKMAYLQWKMLCIVQNCAEQTTYCSAVNEIQLQIKNPKYKLKKSFYEFVIKR